jgi:uncharacterized OsmC-like protein
MLGTLNGALEARGIQMGADDIGASAEGVNEIRDGIIMLTRINIHYELRVPEGSREVVDRALSRHQDKCPTARSLTPAVAIAWTAHIEERDTAAPS